MPRDDDETFNNKNANLNKKIQEHENATIRTTDEIVIVKSADGGESSAPRSESSKMTQNAHAQKYKVSSHGASEAAHNKESTGAHAKPLQHLKPLAPKPPGAPQPPKPPSLPTTPKPPAPMKPIGLPTIKPKI